MSSKATTVADYLAELPADRRAEIVKVLDVVRSAMPYGYREGMAWGLIGWVVPLELHPDTYNKQPLLYAGLGAHKNYNSLYLTCVYASKDRSRRLQEAAAVAGKKLDMGKSCIHFKRAEDLPLDHIGEELASTAPDEFIKLYEEARRSGAC